MKQQSFCLDNLLYMPYRPDWREHLEVAGYSVGIESIYDKDTGEVYATYFTAYSEHQKAFLVYIEKE